jgi:hypothetical protein
MLRREAERGHCQAVRRTVGAGQAAPSFVRCRNLARWQEMHVAVVVGQGNQFAEGGVDGGFDMAVDHGEVPFRAVNGIGPAALAPARATVRVSPHQSHA